MAKSKRQICKLKEEYAGYAPGTEFVIIRKHASRFFTAVPVDLPFRGISLPIDKVEL